MKSHEVFELLRKAAKCIEDGPVLTSTHSSTDCTVSVSCEGASVFHELLEKLPEIVKKLEEQEEKLEWFLEHINPTQELGYEGYCDDRGFDGWS